MAVNKEQIRAAREAAHLTQTEASALINAAMRTWQDWEAGKRKMPIAMFDLFEIRVAKMSNYIVTCDDSSENFETNNPDIAIGYYLALKQRWLNPVFYRDNKQITDPLNNL